MVEKFLMKQKRTAPGPDEIPYWIWKDYASYQAPMVMKIVNCPSTNSASMYL